MVNHPRRGRALVAIACLLALTALAAALATPHALAASGAGTINPFCSPLAPVGAELFGSLARLAPSSTARGGDELREKDLGQTTVDAPRSVKSRVGSAITVPTYVHVITPDGVTGNVPDHKIREQIRVLDLTFAGFYGGYGTGFDFELAGVTRTVNADWYTIATTTAEIEMKQALRQGGNNALNMFLNTAGPYLGWAYYPSVVDSDQAYLDGVVIDWESLPNVSDKYEDRYDRGYTATHEVGHWLNLAHTFDGACGMIGDRVDDTPAELTPTSGCPIGKDSCVGQPGLDPIHNYMDYSYDACYTEFTAGQAARMLDAWNFWRA